VLFFSIQPPAGRLAFFRHSSRQKIGVRIRPGDVADMRPCRAGCVSGLADAAQVKTVNRHPASLGLQHHAP